MLGSDEYVNAIGGQNLYTHEDFIVQGIELRFLRTKEIKYTQFNNDSFPNLSIIDVMMFNESRVIKEMLNNFELLEPKR